MMIVYIRVIYIYSLRISFFLLVVSFSTFLFIIKVLPLLIIAIPWFNHFVLQQIKIGGIISSLIVWHFLKYLGLLFEIKELRVLRNYLIVESVWGEIIL